MYNGFSFPEIKFILAFSHDEATEKRVLQLKFTFNFVSATKAVLNKLPRTKMCIHYHVGNIDTICLNLVKHNLMSEYSLRK